MAEKKCSCPELDLAEWDGRVIDWTDRAFYVEDITYFFGIPIGYEAKAAQAGLELQQKGYVLEEPLTILEQGGRFGGKLFIGILAPENPDPKVVWFKTSKFEASVYRRKEAKIGPGVKAFKERMAKAGKVIKNIYLWHIGCPDCIKSVGYTTIILGEMDA